MTIRKGDTALVLIGKDRLKQGTVERVFRDRHQVIITGINLAKRHRKPSSQYPAGGIIELTQPIDWSNVRVIESSNLPTIPQTRSSKLKRKEQ